MISCCRLCCYRDCIEEDGGIGGEGRILGGRGARSSGDVGPNSPRFWSRRVRETTMTPALEKLAELVRQAEAKTRARKIEGETQQAAEHFRAAEWGARRGVERLRVVRPASLRALEQADTDEQLLK